MNKAFYKIRVISSLIFIGCLILFNLSCGLDNIPVVHGPNATIHSPTHTNNDYEYNYFLFKVGPDNPEIKFVGTEVYYKIYKSVSTLDTQVNDLISISNKDDSDISAKKMIETYLYQPLRTKEHYYDNILISKNVPEDTEIYIRLNNYTDEYLAQVKIGNSEHGIPVRYLPEPQYFTFSELPADLKPKTDDVDVNANGSSSDPEMWFVSMFAIAVGQDENYSRLYSNVLYLGSVKIPIN